MELIYMIMLVPDCNAGEDRIRVFIHVWIVIIMRYGVGVVWVVWVRSTIVGIFLLLLFGTFGYLTWRMEGLSGVHSFLLLMIERSRVWVCSSLGPLKGCIIYSSSRKSLFILLPGLSFMTSML